MQIEALKFIITSLIEVQMVRCVTIVMVIVLQTTNCTKHPNGLQINIYVDDLETVNPLGSKTKIHQMGTVYFSLRNLIPENNSRLTFNLVFFSVLLIEINMALQKIFEPVLMT